MSVALDWSGGEHWTPARRPCTWCAAPTNLVDNGGRPAHKVCTEHAVATRRHLTSATTTTKGNAS